MCNNNENRPQLLIDFNLIYLNDIKTKLEGYKNYIYKNAKDYLKTRF